MGCLMLLTVASIFLGEEEDIVGSADSIRPRDMPHLIVWEALLPAPVFKENRDTDS